MANYGKPLPIDKAGNPMQNFPAPYTSQVRYNSTNAVASSVISLNPNTTEVEVSAFGGQGCVVRWIPTTETATVSPYASVISSGIGLSNFDHYIPAGVVRQFVVPKETGGAYAGQAGSVNGLYQRLAYVNAGITAASVLVSEF